MSSDRDNREQSDGRTPGGALRIGVVSDTHGYLDPNVLHAFAGVDLILHAGDVGDAAILDTLRTVAPVTGVAGNLDGDGMDLPTEVAVEVGDVRFALGHKRKRLTKRLVSASDKKFDLVVFGHEHVPTASWVDGTLWLNPGSASAPYEEDDGPTVAVVQRVQAGLTVCFIPVGRRERQPSL
jgi:uncharacterized protein